MTAERPEDQFRKILMTVVIALAVRSLFGEEIAAFMDGMYIGFTDGI